MVADRASGLISATRPFVEHAVRQRVQPLAGGSRGGVRVSGLSPRPVGGCLVEGTDGSPIAADIVLDATGRASRLPAWLSQAGYGEVASTTVDAGIGYASRLHTAPADALGEVASALLSPSPDHPYGGLALPVEGDRRVGDHGRLPPRPAAPRPGGLRGLPHPDQGPRPVRLRPYGTARRRCRRAPPDGQRASALRPDVAVAGLLVLGDALCAFNPVCGQGITVSAQQALSLRRALRASLRPGTEQRLLRRFQGVASLPRQSATGEDLRYASSEAGQSSGRPFSAGGRALEALAAHGDQRAQRISTGSTTSWAQTPSFSTPR